MGCVINRQAIRQAKRRYNLRPALCYALNINNKINADSRASFCILAQAG